MCPDRESDWRPCCFWDDAQPTEPRQTKLECELFQGRDFFSDLWFASILQITSYTGGIKAHWRKQEEEREKGKNGRESSQTHGTHSELLKHLMPAELQAAFIASWSTGGGDEKYIHLESGRLDLCLSSSPSCMYAIGGLTQPPSLSILFCNLGIIIFTLKRSWVTKWNNVCDTIQQTIKCQVIVNL